MGVTYSNKETDTSRISCDGVVKVTVALTAAPDISANPVDIVLVLDRSGSMAGSPLTHLKEGAKAFIDIIDEATDGAKDGQIGGGTRIGIVSFSGSAVINSPLATSTAVLKAAVDSLTANGSTNHADAFTKAGQVFDPASPNQKVLIIFTDGKTTAGPPPAPVAAALRADGTVIYSIGLIGEDGIDTDALNEWATDPDSAHVVITPDAEELKQIFENLAANISKPGATNIVIDETVNPDFIITSVLPPNKGSASLTGVNTLKWTIPVLGATASEGAVLEFFIRHTAQTSGEKKVNQSITYADTEGNHVIFPDPKVMVDCGAVVQPEPCPEPIELTVGGCEDSLVLDLGETELESLGRILQLNATIKNVCPGKRVALGVVLTEVDKDGHEHPRGTKTVAIPAHHASGCRDIQVRCLKFVLPESLNVSGQRGGFCGIRNLKVRLISHLIDSDFSCCDTIVTI